MEERTPTQAAPAAWASWVNLVAGVWLILAPFVLRYSDVGAALGNDIVLGVLVAATALWGVRAFVATPGWVHTVLGIWLIIAPYALRYSHIAAATANDLILGIVVVAMGLTTALARTPGVRGRAPGA